MARIDLHNHTVWSDGKNTAEEMIRAAIDAGFTVIGISDHSYVAFDEPCSMPKNPAAYKAVLALLKRKYAEQIEVLCGIEQDYYTAEPPVGYDYAIGSVHYLRVPDGFIPLDDTAEKLQNAIDRCYGGDPYALAEDYFSKVGEIVEKTGATIIGHFDLITKFNEKTPIFDPDNPRYRAAWQKAADRLLPTGTAFEINLGAITRGYRTTPYPSAEIVAYLRDRGARFVVSGDSHSAAALQKSAELRKLYE